MRVLIISITITFVFLGCSSKKPGVINCDKNDECPQSYKCDQERGKCVDIYFPYLGGPRGV